MKTQATLLAKKTEAQLQLRAELDQGVREKAERDVGRQQQYLTEAQGIELFKQAKKVMQYYMIFEHHNLLELCDPLQRMTHLRKEKEGELFQQFQSRQQRMAELLQKQRQQERNMEDEAIAKDMEEQLAKEQVHIILVCVYIPCYSYILVPNLLFSKLSVRKSACLWSELVIFRSTAFR